jgi:hypothetical protein
VRPAPLSGLRSHAAADVTPELIAAKKEGKVVWYSATDVAVAEKLARAFEAKYPGIKVQVERSGAERIFQRINQEYGSKIYTADVVETSDAVHFIHFKRRAGCSRPCRPTSPSLAQGIQGRRTASTPPTAPTSPSSPTTPSW